eukprot:gene6705-7798_t
MDYDFEKREQQLATNVVSSSEAAVVADDHVLMVIEKLDEADDQQRVTDLQQPQIAAEATTSMVEEKKLKDEECCIIRLPTSLLMAVLELVHRDDMFSRDFRSVSTVSRAWRSTLGRKLNSFVAHAPLMSTQIPMINSFSSLLVGLKHLKLCNFQVSLCIDPLKLWLNNIAHQGNSLISIVLNYTDMDSHMLKQLAPVLHLRYNVLSEETLTSLCKALESNTMIESLDLSHNIANDAEFIAQLIRANSTLTSLELQAVGLTTAGCEAIAESLFIAGRAQTQSLTSLDLSHNPGITSTGVRAIASVLQSGATSLTSLGLAGCAIGSVGCLYLAAGVANNTSLTALDLAANGIGLGAMRALLSALRGNGTLADLSLALNNAASSAMGALTATLSENRAITSFDLSYSQISVSEVCVLLEGLASNVALRRISLRGQSIDHHIFRTLAQLSTVNQVLRIVDLSGSVQVINNPRQTYGQITLMT